MKAVGAGAALGLAGGTAAAEEHDSEGGEENDDVVHQNTVHDVKTYITASTHPERPADFFFQPTGHHIQPGDVVRFVFETPDHTVTSYHPAYGMQRRIPPEVQPFSSPVLGWDPQSLPDDIDMPPMEESAHGADEHGGDDDGEVHPRPSTWMYAFDTPGVYDLECAPHEAFGMAMRIVVGDETETAFEVCDPGELPPPRTGPVGFSRQVLTDSHLKPDVIVEAGSVQWEDLAMHEEANGNGS